MPVPVSLKSLELLVVLLRPVRQLALEQRLLPVAQVLVQSQMEELPCRVSVVPVPLVVQQLGLERRLQVLELRLPELVQLRQLALVVRRQCQRPLEPQVLLKLLLPVPLRWHSPEPLVVQQVRLVRQLVRQLQPLELVQLQQLVLTVLRLPEPLVLLKLLLPVLLLVLVPAPVPVLVRLHSRGLLVIQLRPARHSALRRRQLLPVASVQLLVMLRPLQELPSARQSTPRVARPRRGPPAWVCPQRPQKAHRQRVAQQVLVRQEQLPVLPPAERVSTTARPELLAYRPSWLEADPVVRKTAKLFD